MHGMFSNLIVDKEEELPKSFPIVWLLVRPKKVILHMVYRKSCEHV